MMFGETVYQFSIQALSTIYIFITCFLYSLLARVALVKCRDLHWAMMAHKEQRDINLSSIRMLIVADGANPCESLFQTIDGLFGEEKF